jgi:hypothetical protein
MQKKTHGHCILVFGALFFSCLWHRFIS